MGTARRRVATVEECMQHDAVTGQAYLAEPLELYVPKTAGAEAKIAERLARWRALRDGLRRG